MPRTPDPIQSKHQQVYRLMAQRVASGRYPLDHPLPSEAQVMQELGVSRVTVRRALAAMVKDGLIESRQGVGYRVRARRTRPVIGIIYGNTMFSPEEPSSYRRLIHMARTALGKQGFTTQLFCIRSYGSARQSDREDLIAALRRRALHAVVVVGWPCPPEEDRRRARRDQELLQLIQDQQVPLTGFSDMKRPGTVAIDYHSVGRLGAAHFLDIGLRRIAVIAGDDSIIDQGSVVEGYRQAMADNAAEVEAPWVVRVRELSRVAGYLAMRRLLRLRPRLQAVVIGDDVTACGVMTAVLEQGVAVPDELSLACLHVNGSPLFFPKPFIQLQIDFEQMVEVVVRRVMMAVSTGSLAEPARLFEPCVAAVNSSIAFAPDHEALIVSA